MLMMKFTTTIIICHTAIYNTDSEEVGHDF